MDGYVITQSMVLLRHWSLLILCIMHITIEFTGSLGTRFEAKLCACLGKHGYQLRQPGLSFCWMHGPGLVEFMHSDDLFELIADIKCAFYHYFVLFVFC
ncbi:hypothetical protein V6Z11_A07G156400 [Gossypium hirsutum]